MHFCVSATRGGFHDGFCCPRKIGTNWFMPALVKSRLGASGSRDDEGTMVCCFSRKKSRKDWRISVEVMVSIQRSNCRRADRFQNGNVWRDCHLAWQTMNPIKGEQLLTQLNWRYATKKFDPARKISPENWAVLENALILSPSSYGLQPWRFIVITDQKMR